jgi:hypothetical protein
MYVRRETRRQDSERFRRRLAASAEAGLGRLHDDYHRERLYHLLRLNLGANLGGQGVVDFELYFLECPLEEALDAITLVHNAALDVHDERSATAWAEHIQRIFDEEHLAYRLGNDGIVHPFVDQEFEVNRAAALDALNHPLLGEGRADFDASMRHLRDGHGKQAIFMAFRWLETAARVLLPGKPKLLSESVVGQELPGLIEKVYRGNEPAITAGRQMAETLKKWITACQPYRHGQEVTEAADPPQDLVVLHLSTGASLLRWLIGLATEGRIRASAA